MNQLPNIYNYKDVILYISDVLRFHQSHNQLSLRKWASILGSDPQTLTLILKRKKLISESLAQKLSSWIKLDPSEEIYFNTMVKYSSADTESEKRIFELVLMEISGLKGKNAFVQDMSIFSHWVHMTIMSLSKIHGFHCTKETVRASLIEDVSEEIIEEAIERLLSHNLIRIDENGSIRKNYDNTTSVNDAYKFSPHDYFQQVSELAKRGALEPSSEREFQCFSLAIKQDKLPVYKELFRSFRAKISQLAEEETSDQVYQVNLQLFPMSEKFAANAIHSELLKE